MFQFANIKLQYAKFITYIYSNFKPPEDETIKTEEILKFYSHLIKLGDLFVYPVKLLTIYITLLSNTVFPERCFSKFNSIKTDHRENLQTIYIDDIIRCGFEPEELSNEIFRR